MDDIRTQLEIAYDNHADAIFKHCYFRVRDRERAKELTQDTFMKTWEYLQDGHAIQNIRAFLYRVAHNLALNEIARRKEHLSLETLREETGYQPTAEAQNTLGDTVLYEKLFIELEQLPEQYKIVLMYRYIDALSVKEIGALLGESNNTVAVRIHRGLEKLKKRMHQYTQ